MMVLRFNPIPGEPMPPDPTQPTDAAWGHTTAWLWPRQFVRDYGMFFVLLALIALFSVLTYTQQYPTGADAGHQVAKQILAQQGPTARVLVVARDTEEDRAFTAAVAEHLQGLGAETLLTVNGGPADAKLAITQLAAAQRLPTALAVNEVAGKWSVFAQSAETAGLPRFKPEPYAWPNFLKRSNLLGVANQTAVYAIIAIGMTMVILTAGIDLSVGSLVALASVVSALWLRDFQGGPHASVGGVLSGLLLGVAVCTLVGGGSGVLITMFRLPPFIVTLGVMLMANGLAFRLSSGASIPELPRAYFWLGGGASLGIPHPVWLMVALYLVAHLLMSRTVFGRYVYAIGSNQEAARLSGVPVSAVLIVVYMISGCLAGLGGIVLASMLQAGDPKFGAMYELEVIAAVVVGGTSLLGGRGKVLGTLIGAFIIAVIKNGMNLTNIDPFNQKIVLGAVLLGAVLLDTIKRRGFSGWPQT
jgi:ribose transport system permease protein